jgi:hypothetical protein
VIQYLWKRGEIIPKIIAVDLSERPENSEQTKYISHCPECQTELVEMREKSITIVLILWMSSTNYWKNSTLYFEKSNGY